MLISGIFFEAGGISKPSPAAWAAWYAQLANILTNHSVAPSYYIIDNLRHRAKFKRYGDSAYRNRLAQGFEGTEILALAATPPGMKEPGFNWSALCSMTYIESYGRLSLEILIEEEMLSFDDVSFESTLESLAHLNSWDFGWALQRTKEEGVEQYLSGSGLGGGLSTEDQRRIQLWYDSYSPDDRRKKVRDVFPCNIIGAGHLANTLRDGRSLESFIKSNPDSELVGITSKLWLWRVKDGRTEKVRNALLDTGVLASG